jgi:universal stress protein E
MTLQAQRIMVAVPPTELANVVVRRGSELAQRLGSELRLAACVYDPYVAGERFPDSPDLVKARAELVGLRRQELQGMAAALVDERGLAVSVTAVWAYPVYEGLVEEAESYGADLLVAGTFHHSLPQRFGLTNTDWQLIRRAPCPVLIARRDHYSEYDHILVAVDPMHAHDKPARLDDRLLGAAADIGGLFDAEIHVLHCYLSAEYIPLLAPGAAIPALFDQQSSEQKHRRAVEELAGRHRVDADRIYVESGDARQLIPEVVKRCGASLVVMGAVSRSRLRQLLVGSTAEGVLDRLDCDVLVIKPPRPGPTR